MRCEHRIHDGVNTLQCVGDADTRLARFDHRTVSGDPALRVDFYCEGHLPERVTLLGAEVCEALGLDSTLRVDGSLPVYAHDHEVLGVEAFANWQAQRRDRITRLYAPA